MSRTKRTKAVEARDGALKAHILKEPSGVLLDSVLELYEGDPDRLSERDQVARMIQILALGVVAWEGEDAPTDWPRLSWEPVERALAIRARLEFVATELSQSEITMFTEQVTKTLFLSEEEKGN